MNTNIPNQLKARVVEISKSFYLAFHLRYIGANFVSGLLPDFFSGLIRSKVYRLAGFSNIDKEAFIMGNLTLTSTLPDFYSKLVVKDGCVIGDHVTINLDAKVKLGKNTAISPRVIIYSGTHQLGPGSSRRLGETIGKPVTIGDGCWVGLAAIIMPGVTIGQGCIVGGGAVVTQDMPANSYIEGNPAVAVRKLPWGDR